VAKRNLDPQAETVYCMEGEDFGAQLCAKVPLRELRRIAKLMCRRRKIPVPNIFIRTPTEPRLQGYYDPNTYAICLHPKFARNYMVLLHELAHHFVELKHPRAQHHGATWMRMYIELLDEARVIPAVAMRAACRERGVKY